MNENLRKLVLYTQPTLTYWQSTKKEKSIKDSKIGFYPLSIIPRIQQGHYKYFDSQGIPTFPNQQGIMIHHYTTLCSYALGRWEKYIQTGEESHATHIIKTADFLVQSQKNINGAALFLDFDDEKEENGQPCAMNQGESISVLIRAHEISRDNKFLQLALAATKAYEYEYGEKGICREIPGLGVTWYQEGGKFILNGHNYALWGLWELAEYCNDHNVKKLFDNGINSLEQALPHFDNGYWSWYQLSTPPYIASMMYHNLHIVQLGHLAKISKSDKIAQFGKKFQQYAANPINRFKAATSLLKSKVS